VSRSPGKNARDRRATGAVLYLEDFGVGRRFKTGTIVVSADDIKEFAARFDPQPFHLDEASAKQSVFGGLVASGWHTAALGMRLLVDGEMKVAGGLIGLGGELTWPRATKPGDVLHVESEVVEVKTSRSRPDSGIVKIRNTALNQNGEAVQVFIVSMLVPRRPG
jgi:acyl dehydratase